jgi:hypothetical protein
VFALGDHRDQSSALNGIDDNAADLGTPQYGSFVGPGSQTFFQSIRAYQLRALAPLGAGELTADLSTSDNGVTIAGGSATPYDVTHDDHRYNLGLTWQRTFADSQFAFGGYTRYESLQFEGPSSQTGSSLTPFESEPLLGQTIGVGFVRGGFTPLRNLRLDAGAFYSNYTSFGANLDGRFQPAECSRRALYELRRGHALPRFSRPGPVRPASDERGVRRALRPTRDPHIADVATSDRRAASLDASYSGMPASETEKRAQNARPHRFASDLRSAASQSGAHACRARAHRRSRSWPRSEHQRGSGARSNRHRRVEGLRGRSCCLEGVDRRRSTGKRPGECPCSSAVSSSSAFKPAFARWMSPDAAVTYITLKPPHAAPKEEVRPHFARGTNVFTGEMRGRLPRAASRGRSMLWIPLHDARLTRGILLGVFAGGTLLTAACSGSSQSPVPRASAAPSAAPSGTPSTAPSAAPTPIDSNHVAFVVQISPGAISAAPNVVPSAVNIYVTGQQPAPSASSSCGSWLQVTDPSGTTAPFPTGGATVTALPFYANGTGSGTTSQVIQLPELCSGRIYISVNGPLSITSASGPAPWASIGAAGFPAKFDMLEYSMPANGLAAPSTDVDTSQENMIGLDLGLNLSGTQYGSQTTGLKAGFMTQVEQVASAYNSTWSGVIDSQWPTRLLSPLSVQYDFNNTGNTSLPGFNPGTFLDSAIQSAWDQYKTTCMSVVVSTATGDYLAGKTVTGEVDANENFDFYYPAATQDCATGLNSSNSTLVAQIPSPFNQNYWIGNVGGGWSSATGSVFMENGPFLLPASASSSAGAQTFTNPYATGSADIGNTVATALNRGVFDPSVNPAYAAQPYCPSVAQLYPSGSPAATQNLWATAVWGAAKNPTYGYGEAYAIPYDDKCGYSTDIKDSGARVITVTVNAD